jgi:hypothetical protein
MYRTPSPDYEISPAPDSPTVAFYTHAFATGGSAEPSISPIKASTHRIRHKRKRPLSVMSEWTEKLALIHEPPHQQAQTDSDDVRVPLGDADQMDLGTWGNVGQVGKDNSYKTYLDYVLSDCAGFYQISGRLCVVQGWDGQKQRVTVSLAVYS